MLQSFAEHCSVLRCVAVRCSALQCAAMRCSVMQCVAACCIALQCIAVCCSPLVYCMAWSFIYLFFALPQNRGVHSFALFCLFISIPARIFLVFGIVFFGFVCALVFNSRVSIQFSIIVLVCFVCV